MRYRSRPAAIFDWLRSETTVQPGEHDCAYSFYNTSTYNIGYCPKAPIRKHHPSWPIWHLAQRIHPGAWCRLRTIQVRDGLEHGEAHQCQFVTNTFFTASYKRKAEHPRAYVDVRPATLHVFILM